LERDNIPIQGLLFGLTFAPRIFTKILKPIMALFRTTEIKTVIFFNNILIIGKIR
jgi:hypothetical protein